MCGTAGLVNPSTTAIAKPVPRFNLHDSRKSFGEHHTDHSASSQHLGVTIFTRAMAVINTSFALKRMKLKPPL